VETKHLATAGEHSDHQQATKLGLAEAGKRRPRTDHSDYLLPMSTMAYLDVIDDTGHTEFIKHTCSQMAKIPK